jgi:hypothetical protein
VRGLKLLDGGLQTRQGRFERNDLVIGCIQPLPRIERILGHKLVQKVDVALKAARSLVQAGRLGAVLHSRDILRLCAIELKGRQTDDDKPQAHCCDSQHRCFSPVAPSSRTARTNASAPCTHRAFIRWLRLANMLVPDRPSLP